MEEEEISIGHLKKNLQIQLLELETLESMFYNPGEIKIEDMLTLANMKNFISGKSVDIPPNLDVTINLDIENCRFELDVTLPHEYPNCEPDVFVRSHQLNRSQHMNLNKDLSEYISSLNKGDPCIFSIILWLQDNVTNYKRNNEASVNETKKSETLVRFWIYSHHIYSKTKRRQIVDQANLFGITGFLLPGKPGIVCVEGPDIDCNEWWQIIRSMNWKKIFCKVTEENKENIEKDIFLKFKNFNEIIFPNSGLKCNHTDMGELYKYLEEHEVAYIFKELFGVDGKSN